MSPVYPASNASFLPAWLLRRIASGEAERLPRGWSSNGVACFIDIVGFTALTEQHAAMGPEGAEALRAVIDAHFAAVIAAIEAWGGEVAAFAGDAMLVVFFDELLGGPGGSARAAHSAAVAVQSLGTDESVLPQRVSLSSGSLDTWALSPLDDLPLYALGGAAVEGLAAPHRLARPGEVVGTDAFAAAAGLSGHRRGEGVLRLPGSPAGVAAPRAALRPALSRASPPPGVSDAALAAWLPRVVRERHDAGQAGWLNEFRTATVLFVEVRVHEPGAGALALAVNPLVAAIRHFEGDTLGLVFDEKGATLVGAFGLPGRAHGDDAARAVNAAVATGVGAGLATGRIYTGLLGAPSRRDYGGMGPPMNLASRLLGVADGGVLLDDRTARAVASRVAVVPGAHVRLKGWAAPVPVFHPRGQAAALPVRVTGGRQAERLRLLDALARGAGQLRCLVTGEPGIGKSILLEQVAEAARSRGVTVWRIEAGAVERSTPYFGWRSVLAAVVAGRPLAAVLRELGPVLAPFAALLNGTWPLVAPTTAVTAQMESAGRAAAIRDMVVALLAGAARGGRKLLVVDDAQWLDGASARLLVEVAERWAGLDVLLGARGGGEASADDDATAGAWSSRLELGAMERADVVRLVNDTLGAPAPPSLVDIVIARGGGHPFYSEQLVLAMREAGALRQEGGHWVVDTSAAAGALPTHAEGLVTARIDALAPAAQLTAKVASVVGRTFPGQAVADVYPREADPSRVPGALLALEQSALVAREAGAGAGELAGTWAFRHAITQEVAYALLPFVQRRALHQAVGEWFRAKAAGEPDWSVLAWHFERAAAVEQGAEALENAATVAMLQQANTDARDLLGRAIALAGTAVPAARLARWQSMLGTVSLRLVAYDEAKLRFRGALSALGLSVPPRRAGLLADLGWAVLQLLGRGLARRGADADTGRRDRMRAAANAHQGLAEAAFFSLELPELLHANVYAILCAERAGEARELALAYGSGAIGAGVGGLHGVADRWRDAAAREASRSAHLPTAAYVTLLGAVYANAMGRLDEGLRSSLAAAASFASLRDPFREASARYSAAFINFAGGQFAEALSEHARAGAVMPRAGNLQLRVWGASLEAWTVVLAGGETGPAVARVQSLLGEGPHHADRILLLGVAASLQVAGHPRDAAASAAAALALARLSPPTTWFQFWSLSAVFDALLAAHRQAPCLDRVRGALRALWTFARMAPVGRAAARTAEGDLAAFQGRTGASRRAWTRARVDAERAGLTVEVARIGARLGDSTALEQLRAAAGAALRSAPVHVEPAGGQHLAQPRQGEGPTEEVPLAHRAPQRP